MREALSPTPEELQRLVEPVSPALLEEAIDATTARAEEILRLVEPVEAEVIAACTLVTTPDRIEVQRLVARVRESEQARRARGAWLRPLTLAGAGAAAIALTLALPTTPETTPSAMAWETIDHTVALNAAITVDGAATVQVTHVDDAGVRVDLATGTAWFEVDPLGAPDLRDLLVVAGEVRVRVMGTRFQVRHLADEVLVEVARGKVSVLHAGEAVVLTAGQAWSSAPTVADGALPTVREVAEELVEDLPASRLRLPAESLSTPLDRPKPVEEVVPDADLADARLLPTPTRPPEGLEGEVSPVEPGQVVDGTDLAKDQWAILQKHIRDGDVQVLTGVDNFLARYGHTPYAEPAQVARLELLIERRDPLEALGEVDHWLGAHPDSRRAVEVHDLRAGLLLHKLQDCRGALPSLAIVGASGTGDQAATSMAWHGICSLELGDPGTAVTSLDRALELGVPEPLEDRVREEAREARKELRR